MPGIHIRDVPEGTVEALKRRAARHERSLQGELRQILSEVADEECALRPLPPLSLKLSDTDPETTWSRREIYGDDGR